MKKLICTLLALAFVLATLTACGDTPAETSATDPAESTFATEITSTTEPTPVVKAAFEGTIEEILDAIVAKAIELDTDPEFGIASIECTPTVVDAERCETVLGLTEDEYAQYIDSAIESKPNGSWFTHSIVVIKLKEGTDVATVANKIVMNTKPNRFGCLKPRAIVGAFAGDYVVFAASSETSCEAVYAAVEALSAVESTRIDRENDWNSSGGLMGGGMLG